MSFKEAEELITSVGHDLAVISELDLLMSGESHLLGQMAATPTLHPYLSSIALLQCYSLETCMTVEMLQRSCQDRSLRQSHLAAQRQVPLMGKHLFPEETVALAGQNLRGDVQHQNLKFVSASRQSAGRKAPFQPPKANIPTQQPGRRKG